MVVRGKHICHTCSPCSRRILTDTTIIDWKTAAASSSVFCCSFKKLYLKNNPFLLIKPMMHLRLKFPFKYRLKLKSKRKVAAWKARHATVQPHHQVSPPPPSCGLGSAWAAWRPRWWPSGCTLPIGKPNGPVDSPLTHDYGSRHFSTSPFNFMGKDTSVHLPLIYWLALDFDWMDYGILMTLNNHY